MFTQENGNQPNAKNIGIVLTDGKSNSEEDTWKVMGFCKNSIVCTFAFYDLIIDISPHTLLRKRCNPGMME